MGAGRGVGGGRGPDRPEIRSGSHTEAMNRGPGSPLWAGGRRGGVIDTTARGRMGSSERYGILVWFTDVISCGLGSSAAMAARRTLPRAFQRG